MKLLNLAASDVIAVARRRGVSVESLQPCIVRRNGDRWMVDVEHPAYPRSNSPTRTAVSLTHKAVHFAASAAKHVAAGMPMATQEQIDARYAICQACEFFTGGACSKCGCPLVRERKYISKLSWAHESCPVGKWGKAESPAS